MSKASIIPRNSKIHDVLRALRPWLWILLGMLFSSCNTRPGSFTKASDYDPIRVNFAGVGVNHRPAKMYLDTGSDGSLFFEDIGAERLKFNSTAGVSPANKYPYLISEPISLSMRGTDYSVRLSVIKVPPERHRDWDGGIGWPAIKKNLLLFDSDLHVITTTQLPNESDGWIKLKVHAGGLLILEVPRLNSPPGLLLVDTGNPWGVTLPMRKWSDWKVANPRAETISDYEGHVNVGTILTEYAWADEISIESIKLTDVVVEGAATDPFPDYVGTLGMLALDRLYLIVDAEDGVAYIRPKSAPGSPAMGLGSIRSKAVNDNYMENRSSWVVDDRVEIDETNLLMESAGLNYALNDYVDALKNLDDTIEKDSSCVAAYLWRGNIKQIQRNYDEAIADYNRILDLETGNITAIIDRGWTRFYLHDVRGAEGDFDNAVKLSPGDPQCYAHRGWFRLSVGNYTAAIADYNHMLAINPLDAEALASRGEVKINQGDCGGALADFNAAIKIDPRNARAYRWRGLCYEAQDDTDKAMASWETAISFNLNNPYYESLYRMLMLIANGKHQEDLEHEFANWNDGWIKTLAKFIDGQIDETALLAMAETGNAGTLPAMECDAYCFIGAMHLIHGDKAGAVNYLHKALDNEQHQCDTYFLATILLARATK